MVAQISGVAILYLMMAIIIEFIVEVIKKAVPEKSLNYFTPALWSILISLIICFTLRLDFFSVFGIAPRWEWPLIALTGILLSAGSVPVHHLFSLLKKSDNYQEEE